MKLALVLFCLAALCTLTVSQIGARVYCGRRLAQTLAYWCQEMEEGTVKRSESPDAVVYSSPWRWAGLSGSRGKRGVVEECCEKPCTLDVLLSYC